MRQFGPIWLLFACCVGLAAAAMARVGATARELERAEARARRRAALEENLQLALWRMDSALAPLIAEESARPYFSYTAFYPAERAYTSMFAEIRRGEVVVPSPLLTYASTQVRLHFQYGPDGRLGSPEVPTGTMRDLAESRYLSGERIDREARRLDELARVVRREDLAAILPVEEPAPTANTFVNAIADVTNQAPESKASNEYMMRSRSTKLAQSAVPLQAVPLAPRSSSTPVRQGTLQAVWIGPALVLARRVRVEEGTYFQGCWLDWDAIRRDLLASVADLLPDPALEPVREPVASTPTRMLTALPVRLVPGAVREEPDPAWSPVRLSLGIAWACLAVAASAVALLLRGALALSERRGTFVSAVTHELRTPLTTFRLYTEMLDEGMVPDADTRHSYIKTLRSEADRLGHLVENVLAFARLERGRAAGRRESVTAAELLDRLAPRLIDRARQAGMELAVRRADTSLRVATDLSVVDQILSNLVDNAVKYAREAKERRIDLDVADSARGLNLTVRDHGPGLTPRAVRRLFRPFSKSAHDAADSAPGVGLGLALSRRLARTLGGDLRLRENGPDGAGFTLTLPIARTPSADGGPAVLRLPENASDR